MSNKIGKGKISRAITQPATGWTPVNGGNSHPAALPMVAGGEELDRTRDTAREQHQAYLDARHRHGVMPIILVPAGDGYMIFEEDVYTAAQYVQALLIPGLYHHAVIDQAAAGKLQAAGHQVVYANQTGGPRER